MSEAKDFSFDEVSTKAADHVKQGATVRQKFTCANCGSSQTLGEANKMFAHGKCEKCDNLTGIKAQGCNYQLSW